jgi:hypothetical protein
MILLIFPENSKKILLTHAVCGPRVESEIEFFFGTWHTIGNERVSIKTLTSNINEIAFRTLKSRGV